MPVPSVIVAKAIARRGGQDRREEEDEKDYGEGGNDKDNSTTKYRGEYGHGEGNKTAAKTAVAKRIKTRSTTPRRTSAR